MAPSIWSDLKHWAVGAYNDTKGWVDDVMEDIVGTNSTAISTSASSAFSTSSTPVNIPLPTTTSSIKPTGFSTHTSTISNAVNTGAVSSSAAAVTTTAVTSSSTSAATSEAAAAASHHGVLYMILFYILVGIISVASIIAALIVSKAVVVRIVMFIRSFSRVYFSNGSFSDDTELGLSSENFSLTANIEGADGRKGLDRASKLRILWYIFLYGETFDEARLRLVTYQFAKNGIGPDGLPLDPKFVS